MLTTVVVLSGLIGLAIGSFLNVVIHRVPLHLSVVRPASACPSCRAPVANRDNIPVLSWLLLRGRCRTCQEPISARYPMVEAATGVLFVLLALRFGPSPTLPAELAFGAGSLALAAIDLEHQLLPRRVVYPTLVLVAGGLTAAAGVDGRWSRLAIALTCGLGAFLAFFALHALRPAWLGFGDVRFAGLLGLALGWVGIGYLVVGFFAANLIGAVVGLALIATGRADRGGALPYGPFLVAGAYLSLLLAGPLLGRYGHLRFR